MYKNIDTFVQGFANGGGVGFERGRGSMYDSYPSAKKEKKKKKKEKSFSDGPGFAITGSGDFGDTDDLATAYEISEALGGRDDSGDDPVFEIPSITQVDQSEPVDPFTDPFAGRISSDPTFRDYADSDIPEYIKEQTPIVGSSYANIISDALGSAGQYAAASPQNRARIADTAIKGLGSLAVGDMAFTGDFDDFKLAGGFRDAITGAIRSGSDLLSNQYFSPEDAKNPQAMTAAREQKLEDIFNVAGLGAGAGVVGRQAVKSSLDSNVAKALRGELGEDFYGPDGPQVAPNVGGFFTPDDVNSVKSQYDNLKSQGLSDYEIESQYGIKIYESSDPLVSPVLGLVKPSSELDVSNISYSVGRTPSGVKGQYFPKTDEIVISDRLTPGSREDIIRHEGEHRFQSRSGLGTAFGSGGPESIFRNQQQQLENLNRAIRNAQDPSEKTRLIADRDRIASIDAGGSYFNNPKERGGRQAQTNPFTTYDPSITATELLDPTINIGKGLGTRIFESGKRAVLPTYGGLSRFREMGPRIPFTDQKFLGNFAEAGLPLARFNMPQTPSTRGNQPVPYLTQGEVSTDEPSYSVSGGRKIPDDIQAYLDDLNKRAPIVEFNNLKGQMIAGGSRGANLEFALDNLARRLGIERPDK